MRSKLFISFILVILLSLIANLTFKHLIMNDIEDFINGEEEDHIYWVLASVEGSYIDNRWDLGLLHHALHWGIMLGVETIVKDKNGNDALSSKEVLLSLNKNMYERMAALFKLPSGVGEFRWYPLFMKGDEIGKLYVRQLNRTGAATLKRDLLKHRGQLFLFTSLLIAGGSSLLLAVLSVLFISAPVRRLMKEAEKIARGDLFAVEAKKKPRRSSKDEISRLTYTFHYMAEVLKRESKLRKHLTSNITHELRTPLTIIKGNIEAVEDGVLSDPNTALNNIKTEISRIITLMEAIEDITRAEESFFKKEQADEVNLKEFIDSILLGMRRNMFDAKSLFIRTYGRNITVATQPEKLHIILTNLLTNAYKFTDKGGVTVSWSSNREGGFTISVQDTGRGISQKELSRIFQRFYKGADSNGKGLGLAIVKELVDIMDGTIDVDSVINKGSKFTISFPIN
ncbi:integral membrane sensor signal transduction histidine kinase [Candidatus Magnetoovum chiemensis]|nr:integral membrane sensor signal transduction histidine kinase [Candidatus Magnetoovum chiemensis]